MKKNRVIAGAMGMMMLGAMLLPVHAEEMTVEYQQASTWTVSIPQTTLSQTEEVKQTVSATAMIFVQTKNYRLKSMDLQTEKLH